MSMTPTERRPELDNCTRDTALESAEFGVITAVGGDSHG